MKYLELRDSRVLEPSVLRPIEAFQVSSIVEIRKISTFKRRFDS